MNKAEILFQKITGCFLLLLMSFNTLAQPSDSPLTQAIRGVVTDDASGAPLSYVTIVLQDIPTKGTITNEDGQFTLPGVPLGRHTLQASFVGYETNIIHEILVTSAKEVYLEISLKESVLGITEIVITPKVNKAESLNKMALLGAHMLSVEESSRYAGGLDDPARLVSSFAGVSPSVSTNGISIHGNAPSLLQWRLEDIEIPNPNHFADISSLGGGVLSSLSGNVLGNSDFFTGAFPAEYSNAASGVFDMKLRNGNSRNFEHTFQAGVLGIDFASEGPLSKSHDASYIFNYRYSTTGLMSKLEMASSGGALDYQDLNFKFNFPTKAGVFSIWGTGLIDKAEPDLEYDPEKWNYKDDGKASTAKQTSAAGGIGHRYVFKDNAYLKTTVAATFAKNDAWEDIFDNNMDVSPYLELYNRYTNLVFTSYYNRKYSAKHTNRTGFTVTNMSYDMDLKVAPFDAQPLQTISAGNGNSNLIAAYTSSYVDLSDDVSLTLGINGQWLTLNNNWTVEPRASVKWQVSGKSSFAFAYGLHSRMEKMDVYFVQAKDNSGQLVNKNLDFVKAHHWMLSYNFRISDDMNIRIEPYFQYLYDVPVVADSSYSILNRSIFYVEDPLVNTGKGQNMGIDFTFEKYLTKGLYYMITASVFDSRYCGGDGVWHDTKFNRNFIVNGLIGKEWMLGRNNQNVLGINLRMTVQGGDRYSPVDEQATLAHPDRKVQYDETRAYSKQFSPMFIGNYTISYRMNRKKVAHEFAIKGINATQYKEYYGHEYNLHTSVVEPNRNSTSLFNLSYKIEF